MPIYPSKTRNKWRVTVYALGKQREWTVSGTKNDAKRIESEKRIALELERPSTRASPSFTDFCEKVYAPHAVQHLRASTWSKVRVYQIATLCRHLGRLRLTAIKLAEVERYKTARARAGVAPSSINNELRVLATVLRFASAMQYPTAPPSWKRLPQRRSGRIRAWTPLEVASLLTAARDAVPELVGLLHFIVSTGVRKGEAIAAEWDWVNFKRGLLEIPVNEAWQPKNGKPREAPIPATLAAALRGPRAHPVYLFPSSLGGRYGAFPEELWRRARDAAGLAGGPHQLRHTYASQFLSKVPDLFLLGQILGHSTARMTELYSHLLPGHLAAGMNAVSFDLPHKTLDSTLDEVG